MRYKSKVWKFRCWRNLLVNKQYVQKDNAETETEAYPVANGQPSKRKIKEERGQAPGVVEKDVSSTDEWRVFRVRLSAGHWTLCPPGQSIISVKWLW